MEFIVDCKNKTIEVKGLIADINLIEMKFLNMFGIDTDDIGEYRLIDQNGEVLYETFLEIGTKFGFNLIDIVRMNFNYNT